MANPDRTPPARTDAMHQVVDGQPTNAALHEQLLAEGGPPDLEAEYQRAVARGMPPDRAARLFKRGQR